MIPFLDAPVGNKLELFHHAQSDIVSWKYEIISDQKMRELIKLDEAIAERLYGDAKKRKIN